MSFVNKSIRQKDSRENLDNHQQILSSSSSYASSGSFSVHESDLRETTPFNKSKQSSEHQSSSKMEEHLNTKKTKKFSSTTENKSCCTRKKLIVIFLIFFYLVVDNLINLILVTETFSTTPSFIEYSPKLSLIDIWIMSLARGIFLLAISLLVLIRHEIVNGFICFVHSKYISLLLCLCMYSFAIIKMLLHAETRHIKANTMAMLIWNFFSSFFFYACWYMLKLLKLRKKIKRDASQKDEAATADDDDQNEKDTLIETLKETNKKGVSLFRIFKFCKPYLHYIILGTILLIIGSILDAFVPYYTGQVLDRILVKKDFNESKYNIILYIIVSVTSQLFAGLRSTVFSIGVTRINIKIRQQVFRALIEQKISFFDKNKTGDLLSRLSSDTGIVTGLISNNLNSFLWNLFKTIGTLAFVFKLSWQLTLSCFIGAPTIFAVGKLAGHFISKYSVKVQNAWAEANNVAEESLSTIRTVRSFANEDGEMNSYKLKLNKMLRYTIKSTLISTVFDWVVKIFELAMTITMLGYGAYLVHTEQTTSGDFISFVIYQLTLGSCISGLSGVYTGLMSASGASEKIFEYLDSKPDLEIPNAHKPDFLDGSIEFKNVHFTYPTRPESCVLKGVSFTVKPGEVVALVGPSGSGKSSCVNLIENFYKPDKGQILIDGVPVSDYNHKFLHKAMALVGQEPVLYARAIGHNIAYGLDENEATQERIEVAARMANAHEFVSETSKKYETECGERGIQLSGGQKQRIAIARALIRNPRILLLDEATSALDSVSEETVQQAIYNNLKGHSVLIIAHRLSTIKDADRIVVIENGEVIETGNHDELLKKNGLYAKLVKKQMTSNEKLSNKLDLDVDKN